MRYGSVCSGIEAASVAWGPLGWEPAFFAEVEPFCDAVLSHRFPDVPNLGDFTKIGADDVGAIDLLVGGTPCQSFSVAGRRGGLDDPRGVLAFEFLRLAGRLRPRWLVFENVPGLLSSGGGRDFGAFLGALGQIGYGWAYRVLDAQFTGLAQRRERVFVVGYLGDWRPPVAVLVEPQSLSGHPPPRREAGEGPAFSLAASVRGSGDGHGNAWNSNYVTAKPLTEAVNGYRSDWETETLVAHTVTANYGKQLDNSDRNGGPPNLIYQCQGTNVGEMGTLRQGNGHLTGGVPFVAHTLSSEGADASEDGTGRGVPLVAMVNGNSTPEVSLDVAMPLRSNDGSGNRQVLAFTSKDYGADAGDLSPTLRAMEYDASHANGGGQVAVSFTVSEQANGFAWERDVFPTLQAHPATDTSQRQMGVRVGTIVRRLTPRECERLQGLPDDWTLVPYRGKPAMDGPRYRAIGNSMAVNVMAWIGRRIGRVETELINLASRRGKEGRS